MARCRPRQDDADLLEQCCGRSRFSRGCGGDKIVPANAKRPLKFAGYEGAEKSGARRCERALSRSGCPTDKERLATAHVQ